VDRLPNQIFQRQNLGLRLGASKGVVPAHGGRLLLAAELIRDLRIARLEHLARFELALRDAFPVDECLRRTGAIDQQQLATVHLDSTVSPRHPRILDPGITGLAATNHQGLAVLQGKTPPRVGTGDDKELTFHE